MRECCNTCIDNDIKCPIKDCKHWINYKDDMNCTLIAVNNNGPLSLREVANRLGVSFVRIKQIQDKALKKLIKHEDEIIFGTFKL